MTDWLTWWFILGGAVAVVLIAFAIALVRQLFLMARTARRMQDELSPVVRDISREASRVGSRSASLQPPTRQRRTP